MTKYVVAVLISAIDLIAQTPNLRVKIEIDNKNIVEQQVFSFVAREIRSLKDVQLIDQAPDANYIIEIVGFEDTMSGRSIGYIFAVLIVSPSIPYAILNNE